MTTIPSRSVQEDARITGLSLCDINGTWKVNRTWFRLINASDDLWIPDYENHPSKYACNTDHPGFLAGYHPAVEEGIVSRWVRFDYYYYYYYRWASILVLNCQTFFVYKLVSSINFNCTYRLCADKGKLLYL